MKIIAAAVRYRPIKTDPACPDFGDIVISVPPPGRHFNILIPLSQMQENAALICEQGFLADDGKFYGRIGAKQIVKDFKQPTIRAVGFELYSEDLW